jgi:hypothetical protein
MRQTLRPLFLVSSLLIALALQPLSAAEGPGKVPTAGLDAQTGEKLVVIPQDWKTYKPFADRFEAVEVGLSAEHVIDLAATRFTTDRLVLKTAGGGRELLAPAAAAFPAELIREPFERTGTDLFVVQAPDPERQTALLADLQARGIEVRGYIPENAYLVRLDRGQLDRLSASAAVFWAGFFQPAWRIDPKLDFVIEAHPGNRLRMQALFDTAVHPNEKGLRAALAGTGLSVLEVVRRDQDWKVRLAGRAEAARELALVPGSLWVERFVPYEVHNNVARTSVDTPTTRGNADGPLMDVEDVWVRGIRGEGQIAAAADTGLSTGNFATLHWDFGQVGSATNPMRVIAAYALGRPPSDWSDDQALVSPPNPDPAGHGTHVSGSILGNGIRSGSDPSTDTYPSTSYAGTAPKAQYVFQSIMAANGSLAGIPANLNTLFQTPYNDGARVHSNSWGAPVAGQYNSDSQEVDQFTWNNKDMVITFSAGNSGRDGKVVSGGQCVVTPADPINGVIDDDSIGAPATAKNCITVGASENYRPDFIYGVTPGDCTSSNGIEQKTWGWFNGCHFSANPIFSDLMADNASGLGAFSSRGPTDDLRFKPEVVAPGIAIISTRTNKNQEFQQWGTCNVPAALQTHYLTLGGTSMSTPLTAGAATLVRQYYVDGWHPNASRITNPAPVAADGFNPSSALVKATLVTGAWDMTPGQYGVGVTQEIPPNWDTGHDVPNNAEGFGRVDLESSLFTGSGFGQHASRDLEVHDVATGLQTGQFQDFTFPVGSSADNLTVTLAWTDPWAAVGAGVKLVNDLDLTVTDPNGTVYFPNKVNSTAGADHRNNLERVKVTAPAAGSWTARVSGFNVPGNGGAGTNTQPFALAIAGVLNLCGNNVIEAPEVCDGTALGGQTCVDHGFDGGVLACTNTCEAFDTSGCVHCRLGTTDQESWNLPVPTGTTPGAATAYLYDLAGNFVYKMSADLFHVSATQGRIDGILYDGLGFEPDYKIAGTYTITNPPAHGTFEVTIINAQTGQRVGRMRGTFRDDPLGSIVGTFSADWEICE